MAFQRGTTASSNARRDLLTKLVAFATSQHISAAVINAAGTGYTAGDLLTITHAGAYLNAEIEVLTVGGGGDILTFAIRSAGAFSNRVASVAVIAGGTGYTTGHIVRLTTGTFTEFAKLSVTAAAGVVTAATVFETGGAYTSAPSAAGATNSDIGLGAGTGLTVTPTMTGLIGTTGAAATGGTGTGATFDITLTNTGHSCVTAAQNRNDYSFNSITDEKEVILQGTVAGGDEPFIAIRSYTATAGITTFHGLLFGAMDSFNSSLAITAQPNVTNMDPAGNGGFCAVMLDNAQDFWFSVDGRRIVYVIKTVSGATTSYISGYAGLMDPFGTQTEAPFPMYLSASTRIHNRLPDAGGFFITGLTELYADTTNCPAAYRRAGDGTWVTVQNSNNGTATTTNLLHPIGSPANPNSSQAEDALATTGQMIYSVGGIGVSQANGSSATNVIMPSVSDGDHALIPCVVLSVPAAADNDAETQVRGELSNVFWTPATKSDGTQVAAEDTIDYAGNRYYIFRNAHRTERYSFFALKAT